MPICRYYVNLRYTLMQVLYDAMFANLIHGLPIARSMVRNLFGLSLALTYSSLSRIRRTLRSSTKERHS